MTRHTSQKPSFIATVPVGYADGYPRGASSAGVAIVRGKAIPIAGRVTMDMIMLDVTDTGAEVGDVVTLIGDGSAVGASIDVASVAALAGLSPYELLTGLRNRIEREYKDQSLMNRAIILVLDGVGAGEAPDAAHYGDAGSNTLAHVARAVGGFNLPALASYGLGNVLELDGMPADTGVDGAWGKMLPASAGKDSTTGHWEIAGVHLEKPFPTYPKGFPKDVVDEFSKRTGRGVIGNVVGSGTDVMDEFGAEHARTGSWILYTSADSVFQIAANEAVIPLEELYAACQTARDMLIPPHDVSRVIARPFEGQPGSFKRTTNRRDYSIEPPGETLLDALKAAGVPTNGVGKVDDLFAGRSIKSRHTASNAEGIDLIRAWIEGDDEWATIRQPSRFRPVVRAPQRRGGVLQLSAGVRLRPPVTHRRTQKGRSAVHHRRPWQRPHDNIHRSRPGNGAAARHRARGQSGETSAFDGLFQTSAQLSGSGLVSHTAGRVNHSFGS